MFVFGRCTLRNTSRNATRQKPARIPLHYNSCFQFPHKSHHKALNWVLDLDIQGIIVRKAIGKALNSVLPFTFSPTRRKPLDDPVYKSFGLCADGQPSVDMECIQEFEKHMSRRFETDLHSTLIPIIVTGEKNAGKSFVSTIVGNMIIN